MSLCSRAALFWNGFVNSSLVCAVWFVLLTFHCPVYSFVISKIYQIINTSKAYHQINEQTSRLRRLWAIVWTGNRGGCPTVILVLARAAGLLGLVHIAVLLVGLVIVRLTLKHAVVRWFISKCRLFDHHAHHRTHQLENTQIGRQVSACIGCTFCRIKRKTYKTRLWCRRLRFLRLFDHRILDRIRLAHSVKRTSNFGHCRTSRWFVAPKRKTHYSSAFQGMAVVSIGM